MNRLLRPTWVRSFEAYEGTMTAANKTVLEVKEVDARYGPVPALKGVSLHLDGGEIVALLGANGAGKTTTLNAIYTILPITGGSVFYYGNNTAGMSPLDLVRSGMCYVPEGGRVFASMTIMDNLILGSYSRRGRGRKGEIEDNFSTVFRLFPVLKAAKKRLAGTLSGGERQMLTLARALMSSPRLLLLDEPSLGLAPILVTEVMQLIAKMREGGLSVLLVEQNARAALRISDRGYVIEGGSIAIKGNTGQLLSDERIRSAYLGEKQGKE